MKSLMFLLVIICFSQVLMAQKDVSGAAIHFLNPNQDIGEIVKGDVKEMTFDFVNTGSEDLQIEIVSGCECTTLDWPRTNIMPGDTATISAIFDSAKKEKSETVEIDVNFENLEPGTDYPMFRILSYTFKLIE